MIKVVPTILTADQNQYKAYVTAYNNFAKRVQIDVCDGQFTPAKTIPETQVWWPKEWTVDLHMMVVHPSEHLADIIKIKPSLCIFHAEAGEDLLPTFAELKKNNIKTGVALLKTTFPGHVEQFIKAADHVLVFGGELGKQGGTANLMQTEKVKLIREIDSNVEIGWDGGANMSNIRMLGHCGIDVINVGSAISTAQDPAAAFKELEDEADKKGIAL